MLARVAKKIPGVGYGTVTATASFDGTVLFTVSGGNQTFTRTAVMNWTTDAPAAAKAVCEAIAVVNGAIELPETSAATYQPPQSPPRYADFLNIEMFVVCISRLIRRLMPSSPSPATVGARVLISKGKRLGDLSYFTVTVSLLPSGDIRFSAVSARDASLSIKRNVSMSELSALSSEPCDSEASIKRAANQLFDRLLVVDGGIDFREAATPG